MKYIPSIKILNRKKHDPNVLVFTGQDTEQRSELQRFFYNAESVIEQNQLDLASLQKQDWEVPTQWLNLYGISDVDLVAKLCRQRNIDNIVIQDILDLNQRPKFQEFENYAFLTIKTTVPGATTLSVEQISFLFTETYLISFQKKRADYFEHIRHRIRESKGIIRHRGPDFLLYALLEAILDNYFKSLDHINKQVNELDLANVKADPSPAVLQEIEAHRAFVMLLKKAILPVKEFASKVERRQTNFIQEENLKYFYEIKDLCLTLLDNCDTLYTGLESSKNLFFSIQGHKMNQVMKTLTIVATIFIPLTFVAGIYGMNFTYMPELDWPYGYAAIWGVMLLIFGGMVTYFKRKGWF